MIPNFFKNSLIIQDQLPKFIVDDPRYATFVAFIEAYYEFLAEEKNVEDRTKNLLNYKDIDYTLDEFEKYFFNEFLPFFPKESLTDKRELVKISHELYQRKSTESSIKFLFRALYDSYTEVVNTKDFVLIPSSGKWNNHKAVRVKTTDPRFLHIKNYKLLGETSKSIAKIENSQNYQNNIEIFITDILREFISGEYVRVVSDLLQDVYFEGDILRAKIIGEIASLEVNPNQKGLNYKPGYPVTIIGGINPDIEYAKPAIAEVNEVTTGNLIDIKVIKGSYGFRLHPDTVINISGGGGTGATAQVTGVDLTNPSPVVLLIVDQIAPYENIYLTDVINNQELLTDQNEYELQFGEASLDLSPVEFIPQYYGFPANPYATIDTRLIDAFTFANFDAYPITEVSLVTKGNNYNEIPNIIACSLFDAYGTTYDLKDYGVLAPIRIEFGGYNYSVGDEIIFTGGSGAGAYANVTSVSANGTIESVDFYIDEENIFTLGGIGYGNESLPGLTINSEDNKIIELLATDWSEIDSNVIYFDDTSNLKSGMFVSGRGIATQTTYNYFQSNTRILTVYSDRVELDTPLIEVVYPENPFIFNGTALLKLDTILGDGTLFGANYDSIGAIKNFNILYNGEDYVTSPEISLRIIDIAVTNVNQLLLPEQTEIIYQGNDVDHPSFIANVEKLELLIDPKINNSFYLRVYNYHGIIDCNSPLYIDRDAKNTKTISFTIRNTLNDQGFSSGLKIYGNGGAKANGQFINGTVQLKGKYINHDGFLSDSNYLQSEIYNPYSYFLIAQKAFTASKEMVFDLINPGGKQVVYIDAEKSNPQIIFESDTNLYNSLLLKTVTNDQERDVFVGGLREINVLEGSNGYRLYPNTIIQINTTETESGFGANAIVTGVDEANIAPVRIVPVDRILPYANVYLWAKSYEFTANPSANIDTCLIDAFTFVNFDSFPISEVTIIDSGLNYFDHPNITAISQFTANEELFDLREFGILSPININYGGANYQVGDVVNIIGGSGVGAFANVSSIDANGTITKIDYIFNNDFLFTLGGLCYYERLPDYITISGQSNTQIIYGTGNVESTIITIEDYSIFDNVQTGMYVSGDGITSNANNYFGTDTIVISKDVGTNTIIISAAVASNSNNTTFKFDGTAQLSIFSILGDNADLEGEVNKTIKEKRKLIGSLIDTNVLKIYELRKELTGISLSSVLSENDYIEIVTETGQFIKSKILSIDNSRDIIYLKDHTILDLSNVAYGYANAESNTVTITALTGNYDLLNNGLYSNTQNYLYDIVSIGDSITIGNNHLVEINNIDYDNRILTLEPYVINEGSNVYPLLISFKRKIETSNVYINYKLEYAELLSSGNVVVTIYTVDSTHITGDSTKITIGTISDVETDNKTLTTESDELIYTPIH